ncbi:MAG: O-antigen ligase family protein [Burkholderiaceae bacterium]
MLPPLYPIMPNIAANRSIFTSVTSFSIFLFYAINQPLPSGYSYGVGLLLLTSIAWIAHRPSFQLTAQDKSYIWILLGVFGVGVLTFLVHGNSLRDLDISSRYLLAIPIFLLLMQFPPRLKWLWAGIALSGCTAASIAFWQISILGWIEADGLSNGVRYGAICTMLCILCIAGMIWARRETLTSVWWWRLALGLGALGAWYGSLMSGTRGAWVALPIVFILFCIGLFSRRNLRKMLGVILVLLLAVSVWLTTAPNNRINRGYRNAVTDISNYIDHGVVTGSIGGRFLVWHAAINNMVEKPLLGWGVKEYRDQLEWQVAQGTLDPYALELAHTHNMYLETLVFQGLVGLLAILALFILPFWYFCQKLRAQSLNIRILAISGASLLAVYAILGLTYVSLYRNDILLFFLVTLMTLWACMRAEERAANIEP